MRGWSVCVGALPAPMKLSTCPAGTRRGLRCIIGCATCGYVQLPALEVQKAGLGTGPLMLGRLLGKRSQRRRLGHPDVEDVLVSSLKVLQKSLICREWEGGCERNQQRYKKWRSQAGHKSLKGFSRDAGNWRCRGVRLNGQLLKSGTQGLHFGEQCGSPGRRSFVQAGTLRRGLIRVHRI